MPLSNIFPFASRSEQFGPGETDIEDRNFTDTVTNALIENATSALASTYTSALEIAASQLSRAFASATITGPGAPLVDPWAMAQIGRALVEDGEAVWYRVGRRLMRPQSWSINPDGSYQVIARLSEVRMIPNNRVFHVRWNLDINTGFGIAPLATARTLRMLLARLENSMSTEAQAAVGYLLPVPADGDDRSVAQLKTDLENLAGRIAIVETTRGGWGDGPSGAPRRDFELARMGPNIPDGNVSAFVQARNAVLAACGYPIQLAENADGTAQREAWRRYLHGTVSPLGTLVETEAARIGTDISISWDRLFASDIQGRARAFQSLVQGGMSLEAAAAASGILEPEQ